MADSVAKDAAAKARIIQHLNKDHQRSLSYYLQHYNSLSSFEARSPTLVDITFDYLSFQTASGNTSTIPLYPPMTSWAEARLRTVEMDRVSRSALGISSIAITEYEPPASIAHRIVFGLCIFALVSFTTRPFVGPGTWVYENLLPFFPGGPERYLWITKMISLPTLVIHLGEAMLLDRVRLRKHGVEMGSALWWKWMGSCFLEGFGCFQRIDATVKRKEVEAEKAKH